MHESSLAKRILTVVLEKASAASARRVRTVRGWIAETESLSPGALDFHFAAHARGTLAEGAQLDLRLVHLQAQCHACGLSYPPEHHLLLCPGCGSTDGRLLGRTGLGVDSVDVE